MHLTASKDVLMTSPIPVGFTAYSADLVSAAGLELIWPLLILAGLLYVSARLGEETDGRKR